MNQNLPNPLRDALARQARPDTHPSPDVLTAFVEHVLSGGENHRVTEHLARCEECREIVFLASSAIEEPTATEQDWLAAAAAPRISPTPLAKAHAAQTMGSASPAKARRRRWAPRMVWIATFAAVALVVAGILVQQRFVAVRPTSQLASKVASNAPALPSTGPQHAVATQPTRESAPTTPSYERKTKRARTKSVMPSDYDAMGVAPQPSTAALEHSAVPPTSGNNAIQKPATNAIGGPVTAAAPPAPRVNSFAASEADRTAAEGAATRQLYAIPQVSIRGVNVTHPQWRVTTEGHVEHFAENGWTRVLANQTTAFRVVSVVGDQVWVGGNGGALFHSSDKGRQWGRVSVVTTSGTVTATIVSIQFDDPQNGLVITESGSRYGTSDGGITWSSQ